MSVDEDEDDQTSDDMINTNKYIIDCEVGDKATYITSSSERSSIRDAF